MTSLLPIPGVRLKIRTEDDYLTATVWVDEAPVREIGRVWLKAIGEAGSDAHQGWLDLMTSLFECGLRDALPESISGAVLTKRRRPDYRGEHP